MLFPCIDLPLGRGGGNGVLMWGVFLSQLKIQANFLNPVVYVIFSVCFCTSACTDKVFFSLLAAWTGKICCSLSIQEFQIHK